MNLPSDVSGVAVNSASEGQAGVRRRRSDHATDARSYCINLPLDVSGVAASSATEGQAGVRR